MKKLINDPDQVVTDALRGMAVAHPELRVDLENKVIFRGDAPVQGVDDVEALRNAAGGFDLEVTLAHPTGLAEIYTGTITGPRIDLATSSVQLAEGAHAYESATRMYGLVNNMLFWAWDIAALGQELATHASGQLSRITTETPAS